MSTTTDATQLSPCVELFIELLLGGASAVTSREVTIVRQPQGTEPVVRVLEGDVARGAGLPL